MLRPVVHPTSSLLRPRFVSNLAGRKTPTRNVNRCRDRIPLGPKAQPRLPYQNGSGRTNLSLGYSLPPAPAPAPGPLEKTLDALNIWVASFDARHPGVKQGLIESADLESHNLLDNSHLPPLLLLATFSSSVLSSRDLLVWLRVTEIHIDNVYAAARYMVASTSAPAQRSGTHLLGLCAALGHPDAVVYVLYRQLKNSIKDPSSFHSSSARRNKNLLTEICKSTLHVQALTLAAMLARIEKRYTLAIQYCQKAMPSAMETYKTVAGQSSRLQASEKHHELSKPWVELALTYYHCSRYDELSSAIRQGVDLDDPGSCYTSAVLKSRLRAKLGVESSPDDSLEWLQLMTKAAASGHVLAMFELASYYASPQSCRPTAPSPRQASFLSDMRAGFDKSPGINTEQFSTHLDEPEARMRLALSWLDIAIDHSYAKAAELKARLLATEELSNSQDDSAAKNPFYDTRAASVCLQSVLTTFDELSAPRAHDKLGPRSTNLSKEVSDLNIQDLLIESELISRTRSLAETLGLTH